MRLLILGGTGRIGSELLAAADRQHQPHLGTYCGRPRSGLTPLDVRDADGVRELIADYEPDAVVWAAPALPEAVADVAAVVAGTGAAFVLVSGDGVLGECKVARREEDALKPVGELAVAQVACEAAVRAALPERHLIARTGFVFGTRSKSDPLNRLVRQLLKGETALCDDEAVRMPTFAPDFADAVLTLLGRTATGTFHLVGPDRHTEFSFARTAAMVCGLDADLVHQRTAFETVGPKRVNLDRFKAMSALGRTAFRCVGDGVRAVRDRSRVAVPALKAA
jgi:dTDP-4-dehydrorhamnose reductase